MARFSEGLCKRRAGLVGVTITGTGLALVDGGGSDDQITDIAAGLATITVGNYIEVVNPASASNQIYKPILKVSATAIHIPTGSFVTSQSSGTSLTIRDRYVGDFANLFFRAQLDLYSGNMPTTPDYIENGTLLASFTNLRFGAEVWDATNLYAYLNLIEAKTVNASVSGTVGWARLRGNDAKSIGASTTMIRADLTVGVGTGEARLSAASTVAGSPITISSCKVTFKQLPA